ncbi:LysR family transcriptional regulator [Rhizobium sp. BK376]|uniref:LysR family transcriptional regulator n=1 Tax=Rhizobium sp. BK376 TaxID=2512149 RepID=UPI001047344C|nr:LysR family transcriptional regulator [Rhizobium sp. BK376]TCR80877.1 DNA-binding transcriptional LysR family regulator [Rhizobium sp. BK376]
MKTSKIAPSSIANSLSAAPIRYFFEVSQAGSFRQAAEKLGIASSAVHRQVGLLEAQLGTALLQRGRGREGVRLTAAGELLVYRISRAMREVSIGIAEIDDLRKVRRGKVRVGSPDMLAIDAIAPFLRQFLEDNPRIEVDVRIADKAELLANHERLQFDLLLSFNTPQLIGLKVLAEFEMQSYAVVPAGHPISAKDFTSLAECAQFPLALINDPAVKEGILTRMEATAGFKPRVVVTTNSYAFMREVVASGSAISIQAAFEGELRYRNPELAYVPIRESLGRFSTLGCLVPVSRRLSAAADLFIGSITASLASRLA